MIITCYRYSSGFRNVMDTISLVPPSAIPSMDRPLLLEEYRLVLPDGYELGTTIYDEPKIYDDQGYPCELCLNNLKGTAVLLVSATGRKGLRRAPEEKEPVKLQEARLAAGLTQKQLAEVSGVNVRQIQRVESGDSEAGNLSARNLLAIASALGREPQDLI